MKARNTSEINKKAKSWLGLLNYRLAQDSADAGEFSARLKAIAYNAIQDCNFDALPKLTVNTDPMESKTRLIRGLRSLKSQKRAGDYLKAYRYYQEVQADYNPGWQIWAELEYGYTWRRIHQISEKTGSSFKW